MKKNLLKNDSYEISLTAMVAALSLMFLYFASISPVMKITFYFLSSIFVVAVLSENRIGMAITEFVVVSLLSLLFVPNLLYALPFVLLFGHYGIGKYVIEQKMRNRVVATCVKLIYFDVCMFLNYILAKEVFFGTILEKIPLWGIVIAAQAVFFVYDILYSYCAAFYSKTLRKYLAKR